MPEDGNVSRGEARRWTAGALDRVRNHAGRLRQEATLQWWRACGAQIGSGVHIYGRVHVEGPLGNLELGDGCTLNEGVLLNTRSRIRIGREARISSHAQLITASLELERVPRHHTAARIEIGDGAWVAAGSIVCGGVSVGRGAVVAAGAVVVHDVEAQTLVGGMPAALIRRLAINGSDPRDADRRP